MSGRDKQHNEMPVALTIAGSDSGGGAGIQADLKTFAARRVFGTSVLTVITAQNTRGVQEIQVLPKAIVVAQYGSVVDDLKPVAAKTGALATQEMIETVSALLEEQPIEHLVVDPVMISKHGHPLMDEDAFMAVRDNLLPHALLATPNRFEAAALTGGRRVESVASMKEAARRIYDFGARHVIVKGGHFDKIVRDIFYDGTGFIEFGADRVDSERLHGSGCTFSAAVTAQLAHGDSLTDALGQARQFISAAIEGAPQVGSGIPPVNPMHQFWEQR